MTSKIKLAPALRRLGVTLACLLFMSGLAFGQQSFSWAGGNTTPNSGSYAPGSVFTLQLMGTFAGFNAVGFSMWLETNSAFAPFLTVIGANFTGATWTSPNDDPIDYDPGFSPFPKAFTSSAASPGFMSSYDTMGLNAGTPPRTGDFGATGASRAPGTYLLTTITFQLAANAPLGTFTLRTTTTGRQSIFADSNFIDRPVGATPFSLTVIPEPSTVGLGIIGGALLLGLLWRKRAMA